MATKCAANTFTREKRKDLGGSLGFLGRKTWVGSGLVFKGGKTWAGEELLVAYQRDPTRFSSDTT